MEKLPLQIFSYLGNFLELKDIYKLSLVSKSINNKIKKDLIFGNYVKKNHQINNLPINHKSWSEFIKEILLLKWGKYSNHESISKDKKIIKFRNWGSTITNLSFSSGKHFLLLKLHVYQLAFFGCALPDAPLESYCYGDKCWGYSSYYDSHR